MFWAGCEGGHFDSNREYFNMRIQARLLAVALSAAFTAPAWACSICRCGDPTFNALGKEGVSQSGLRIALDWDQVKKTQGDPKDDFDSLRERRETLLLAYGFSPELSLIARVPYSQRNLTESRGGELEQTSYSGFADPEVYGQMRLWSSAFEGSVGIRSSLYLVAGIKTAWGENNATANGARLDEHVQPGTGSTDGFAGLSGSYQMNPRSALFASVQYRRTGRNAFHYHYGNARLFNIAYEHKIGARWDAVIEANYRNAGCDEINTAGTRDPNTGGSITYLTPRILFDLGKGWILRASSQFPLYQSGLNGHQEEKAVLNLGVTHVFLP